MTELTKYQKVKMYLPVNGYDSMADLARDWDCTPDAIRRNARGIMKSDRLDKLISDFIKEGGKRFQEHRSSNIANCKG